MLHVFPDYYQAFRCVGGSCRHNCCIGWEIDIDPDSAARYAALAGPLGDRLRKNICLEDTPHFILGQEDRCPFLNDRNLCDLILDLGEASLCQICTDHPRFHNELPGRLETGLGLCCEEAGRLILGKSTPTLLVLSGEEECLDDMVEVRDQVLDLLRDRRQTIPARADAMLTLCGASLPCRSWREWAEFLLALERLDGDWTSLLTLLRERGDAINAASFDQHMDERQTEYEQLLVYLVYRHMANALDIGELSARASFAAFGYRLLYTLGALLWDRQGFFTLEDQVELARLFSSELEYSEENMEILLDELTS